MKKAEYVRQQAAPIKRCPEVHPRGYACELPVGHAGNHRPHLKHACHWPGCEKEVPPALWGCKPHWFRLPRELRNRVWATFIPGQEITKTPSEAYMAVAAEVQMWIHENAR